MSSIRERLKAIEHQLGRLGAEPILLAEEIDDPRFSDERAEAALRGEYGRLAQISQLNGEMFSTNRPQTGKR